MNRINLLRCAATVAIAAMLTGFGSCSKEQESGGGSDDGVIRISSSIGIASEGGEAGTKALNTTTEALSGIYFFRRNSSSTALLANMCDVPTAMTAFGNRSGDATGTITWTSNPVPKYSKDDFYAHLVACHPGSGSGVTTSATSVTWTIDGKTDIMTTARFVAGAYTNPSTASMAFAHRLAALEVIIKAQEGVSADIMNGLWGQITKIEMIGTAASAIYNATLAGTNEGMSYTDSGEVPLLKGTTYNDAFEPMAIPASDAENATAVCGSGMFAPSTGVFTLRIHSTGGSPVDVAVQLKNGSTNVNFLVGRKHTVTLILSVPERTISVEGTSVTPWGEGGASTGSVTPPSLTRSPSMGFLDWNYTGLVKSGVLNISAYTIPVFTISSYNSYTIDSNGGKYLYIQAVIESERPFMVLEVAEEEQTGTGTGWLNTTVQAGGKGNASGGGGTYVNVPVSRADWATAYATCKAKTTNGGGWRLPRASELVQMRFNFAELNKKSGFTALSNLSKWRWRPPYTDKGIVYSGYWYETYYDAENSYWVATEGVGATAWMVCLGGINMMHPMQKTVYYRVRCVREAL